MKFDSLILAHSATVREDNLVDIVGSGVTRVTAEEFPWREPSLVAINRFQFEPSDMTKDTEVQLRVIAPSGSPIAVLRMVLTPDRLRQLAELPDGEFPLLNVIAQLDGIAFSGEGTYTVVTSVDGSAVDHFPLVVVGANHELELVAADPGA